MMHLTVTDVLLNHDFLPPNFQLDGGFSLGENPPYLHGCSAHSASGVHREGENLMQATQLDEAKSWGWKKHMELEDLEELK